MWGLMGGQGVRDKGGGAVICYGQTKATSGKIPNVLTVIIIIF